MRQEEITLQTLQDREDITIGYSDQDIVIVDSIQKFAEISAAHVSMNAIAICTKGKIQAVMNGHQIEMHANEVILIPQNVTIVDPMISPDCDFKVMLFTNRILQSFLREKMNVWNDIVYIRRQHTISMDEEELRFYTLFYEMLNQCFSKPADTPFRTEVIQSLLRSGILALCGALQLKLQAGDTHHDIPAANNYFQQFLHLLSATEVKHQPVGWYASELCISAKYLSSLCKKHSGKTANEWITEHVMEDIRYHLHQSDLSIKQISDRLGFANPSFFGKYVKEHFGVTPSQLQKGEVGLSEVRGRGGARVP